MTKLSIEEFNELKELKRKEKEDRENLVESLPSEVFDPGKLDEASDTVNTEAVNEPWFPKKRGRKQRTPKVNKDTQSDLNGLLWMIHQGLATLTGIEELALDPSESEELSKSIARVQAFYPNSVLSPMAMAWTGLFVTAGKVYGTRIIAVTAKKKQKNKNSSAQVVEIPLPIGTAKVADFDAN